ETGALAHLLPEEGDEDGQEEQQDDPGHVRLLGRAIALRPAYVTGPAGSQTRTRVPCPGAEARSAGPLWATAMAWTIDNPRPLPPSEVAPSELARPVSAPPSRAPRWNRSNARAASSGFMPGPVSATSMRAPPAAALSRSVTGVPAGVCSRTLPSRLASTWRIRG